MSATQQLDQLFTRENIIKNKYLLKHLDSNLNLPIVILHKEHSFSKLSIDELLASLKQCKNCLLKEGYITLLIPPHTRTIIINEISQSHAEFKALLLQEYLKDVQCEITFEGGCCRVIFQDDESGLKFLDQAVNSPQNPLKAYLEPENVYQSLTKMNGQPYYIDNQMFQNLYIRKASDDHQLQQQQQQVKPFYPPPVEENKRKKSEQVDSSNKRKKSEQVEEKRRKQSEQVEEKHRKKSEQVDEKKRKQSEQVDDKKGKHGGPYYVEKQTQLQQQTQSPYVEKKSTNSRKTSEQVYVPKHKEASPIRKAQIAYKKEQLVDLFKTMFTNLKCNPNLMNLNEQDKGLLMRFKELGLEIIKPTRKDSIGTPMSQAKQTPQRSAKQQ